jgi:hypothetical protein
MEANCLLFRGLKGLKRLEVGSGGFISNMEESSEEWPLDSMLDLSPPSISAHVEPQPLSRPTRRRPHIYQKWTDSEDQLLQEIVPRLSEDWKAIAPYFPLKAIASIRKRWDLRFNPSTNKGPWTPAEDEMIMSLRRQFNGGYWKTIAKHLPGRPPDAVKSRYYTALKEREKAGAPSPPGEKPEERRDEEVPEADLELLAVYDPIASKPVSDPPPTLADRHIKVKALTEALKSLEDLLERTKREVKLIAEELSDEFPSNS